MCVNQGGASYNCSTWRLVIVHGYPDVFSGRSSLQSSLTFQPQVPSHFLWTFPSDVSLDNSLDIFPQTSLIRTLPRSIPPCRHSPPNLRQLSVLAHALLVHDNVFCFARFCLSLSDIHSAIKIVLYNKQLFSTF